MRSLMLLPFLATFAFSDVATATPHAQASPAPSPSDSRSANDFNFALYRALPKGGQNVFFSAPSVRQALGIAYLGAQGSTAREMSSAIHLDADPAVSASSARAELAAAQSAKGSSSLSIANRLWTDKSFTLNPDFAKRASSAYGSPTDPVDFSHHPDDARLTINAWVAGQTNDKIKDLLPAPAINSDTRLVITNAIWFKGDWAVPFDKAATRSDPFFVDAASIARVPMMHQTSSFGYASVDGAKILEMRYGKSDLAMDVVLPDAKAGLAELEDKLATGRFATWTSSLTPRKVDVSFPKVTIAWGGSVKDTLKGLGMRTAFDPSNADLRGIASPREAGGNLYVSDVIHKAFVAIDEKGTEAAASTAVIIAVESSVSVEPPPVVFKADHPFLFVIRDVKHGRILFMGRVTNPSA